MIDQASEVQQDFAILKFDVNSPVRCVPLAKTEPLIQDQVWALDTRYLSGTSVSLRIQAVVDAARAALGKEQAARVFDCRSD